MGVDIAPVERGDAFGPRNTAKHAHRLPKASEGDTPRHVTERCAASVVLDHQDTFWLQSKPDYLFDGCFEVA